MKKVTAIILVICMILSFAACGKKEEPGIDVYVSISTKGEIKLAAEKIRVADLNSDGKYNLDEVLKAAHKKAPNKDGSYATEDGQYGLAVTKLWDDENKMSGYGYMINNSSAMNLNDEVKAGDYVYAYSYKDLTGFSDAYTWFDKFQAEANGKELELHLSKMGYDSNWNVVTEDYAGAEILINGTALGTTDENGNFIFAISGSGKMTITAADPNAVIVPAICIVSGK